MAVAPTGAQQALLPPTACRVLVVENDPVSQRLVHALMATLGVTHTHVIASRPASFFLRRE